MLNLCPCLEKAPRSPEKLPRRERYLPGKTTGFQGLLEGAEKVLRASNQCSLDNFSDLNDFLLGEMFFKIRNCVIHVITFFDCRPTYLARTIIALEQNSECFEFCE
jgi:hypothetical protein